MRGTHVLRDPRRSRRASTSASVGPVSSGANDCTGLRAATGGPRRAAPRWSRAANHVLPTSVPVPVTTTITRWLVAARRELVERGDEPLDLLGRCARPRARRAAARCRPAPSAAGSRERAARARAAPRPRRARAGRRRTARARSARGGRAARARRARAGGRRDASPSVLVSTPSAASAAAVSAGVDAVVKMYERARLTSKRRERRRRRRRTRRASPASSTACRPAPRRRRRRRRSRLGSEHGVGLVEHEQRRRGAPRGGRAPSRSARSPSIEKTVSVTTSARRPLAVARAASRGDRGRRGGRPRPSRATSRQPSMIDAWLSSSEHTSTSRPAEVGEHAEVGGEAGGEQDRALGRPSTPPAPRSSSPCTGREPTMRRAEPDPAPQRSRARVRGGDHRGVLRQARGSRSTRTTPPGRRRGRRCRPGPPAVEVARLAPASRGADRRRRRGRAARLPRPTVASRAHLVDGRRRARRRCARSRPSVIVSGGIERRPRRRAGARARRARRSRRRPAGPSADRAAAAPARRRPSARRRGSSRTAGMRTQSPSSRSRELRRPGPHVGEHVPLVEQLEVAQRRPRPRARSRRRSGRGRRCARPRSAPRNAS